MAVSFGVGLDRELEPQASVEVDRLLKVGDDYPDGIEPCDKEIMTRRTGEFRP
jgi:hypothetical protein